MPCSILEALCKYVVGASRVVVAETNTFRVRDPHDVNVALVKRYFAGRSAVVNNKVDERVFSIYFDKVYTKEDEIPADHTSTLVYINPTITVYCRKLEYSVIFQGAPVPSYSRDKREVRRFMFAIQPTRITVIGQDEKQDQSDDHERREPKYDVVMVDIGKHVTRDAKFLSMFDAQRTPLSGIRYVLDVNPRYSLFEHVLILWHMNRVCQMIIAVTEELDQSVGEAFRDE